MRRILALIGFLLLFSVFGAAQADSYFTCSLTAVNSYCPGSGGSAVLNGGIDTHNVYIVPVGTPGTITVLLQGSVIGDFSDAVTCGTSSTTTANLLTCSGIYTRVRVKLSVFTGFTTVNITYVGVSSVTKKGGGGVSLSASSPIVVSPNPITGTGTISCPTCSTGGVTSFNSRTGAVTPQSGDYTASLVGLGSVTNDAQTKAAIVPNTAPSAGQIPVGNAGGTAYAPVTMSGSCTMTSAGVTSCAGGSPAFNTITSGTNTTAAMVLGSGSSLTVSGTGTNTATAVPVAGITGLGSGIATFLATPSSANLAAALTTSTGTGLNVFNNGPTFIAPILGTPASGVVTNLTGTGGFNTTGTAANLSGTPALPNGTTATPQTTPATADAKLATDDTIQSYSAAGAGVYGGSDTGTANAYAVSPTNCTATLSPGFQVYFEAANASTSATPTLAYCGGSAVTITKNGQSALLASPADIITTKMQHYVYDGTDWELEDPATTAFTVPTYSTAATGVSLSGSGATLIGSSPYTMVSSLSASGHYRFTAELKVTTQGTLGTCSTGSVAIILCYTDADTSTTIGNGSSCNQNSGQQAMIQNDGTLLAIIPQVYNAAVGTTYWVVAKEIHAKVGTGIYYSIFESAAQNCTNAAVIQVQPVLWPLAY